MKKNVLKMFLIAQKKCPDALNKTQKNLAFYDVRFLKNQENPSNITNFFVVLDKNGYFYEVFRCVSTLLQCKTLSLAG